MLTVNFYNTAVTSCVFFFFRHRLREKVQILVLKMWQLKPWDCFFSSMRCEGRIVYLSLHFEGDNKENCWNHLNITSNTQLMFSHSLEIISAKKCRDQGMGLWTGGWGGRWSGCASIAILFLSPSRSLSKRIKKLIWLCGAAVVLSLNENLGSVQIPTLICSFGDVTSSSPFAKL